MTPEETWERLAENLATVMAGALADAIEGRVLRRSLFVEWHHDIFGELFPEHGGHMRTERDKGQFGLALGTRARPVETTYVSLNAKRVPRRLDELCAGFEAATENDREYELAELVRAAVRIYIGYLNAHPFIDGNGRTGFVLLQYALARVDLPAVGLPDYAEHHWAVSTALRRDGRRTDDLMCELVISRLDDAARIQKAIQAEG